MVQIRRKMLEELKNWIFNVARDFINCATAGAGELCDETIETAGTICDETKKANADFLKAIMSSV
jgi:hypothetical protein|tara:strand:+ start:1004 stop:1198 length:195 start_codon:yes stop_codon:yes gene_type:complete